MSSAVRRIVAAQSTSRPAKPASAYTYLRYADSRVVLGAVAILDAGRHNRDHDQQAEGVGTMNRLRPLIFFPCVVATGVPAHRGGTGVYLTTGFGH
jgi:hypothetical protein